MCGEKCHEKETFEYYCKQRMQSLYLSQVRHFKSQSTHHGGYTGSREEHRMQIAKVVEQAKTKIAHFELQVARETELFNKSREDIQAARDKVRTTIEELVRIFREHEMAMVAKLDEVDEERQRCHTMQ